MEIKVKYLADIEPLVKSEKGDWIDLRAAVDVDLKKGELYMIPLGVAIKLPDGYEAIVAPRSSSFKHWGIIMVNSVGIIDNSYSGDNDEWKCPVLATEDAVIRKNDRICQFRILYNQPVFDIKAVDHLEGPDRGGFGSTGRK